MDIPDKLDLLDRIEWRIQQNGWSKSEFLRRMGMSSGTIADWRAGKSTSFLKYLPEIAGVLGVSEAYLRGTEEQSSFNERVRSLRRKRGITIHCLAQDIGMRAETLSRIESGEAFPTYDSMNRLADYFGVTTDYLLGRTDETAANVNSAPSPENVQEMMRALERLGVRRPDGTIDYDLLAAADSLLSAYEDIARKRKQD